MGKEGDLGNVRPPCLSQLLFSVWPDDVTGCLAAPSTVNTTAIKTHLLCVFPLLVGSGDIESIGFPWQNHHPELNVEELLEETHETHFGPASVPRVNQADEKTKHGESL